MSNSDFNASPAPARTDQAPALGGSSAQQTLSDAPRLGGDAALARLIEALHDPDSLIRERAAEALGDGASDQRVIEMLLEAMQDRSASVRMRAAQALGNAYRAFDGPRTHGEDPRIHDALLAALRDEAAGVRRGAAGALARIGRTAAAAEIFPLLHDADVGVQCAAAEALGVIGGTLPDEALKIQIVRALLDLPSRSQYGVYQRALRAVIPPAIARVGDAGLAALQEALERYNRASEVACEALGLLAIQTETPAVRAQAILTLLATSWEPDVLLADTALRVLGSIAPRLPEARLFDRALTEMLDLFHATGPMLAELNDGVPDSLTAHLEGRSLDYLRPALVQTLGRLGASSEAAAARVVPALIEATYDLDTLVWFHALSELRQIAVHFPDAASAAVPALMRHLSDTTRPALRETPRSELAAAALRQIGSPEALDALDTLRCKDGPR